MAGKVKVVGYVRVSTLMQVMGKEFSSIQAQQVIIKDYVAGHPEMELVEIFTDPGRSGKNMNRPGMQELLKRIRQGDIKYVLSYKLDRISRDKFDYYEFEKLMREHNVRVHYTNDVNSDGSPAGELMKDIMTALAVFERNQTSQRIKDKITESLKAGYRCGGHPPLGYVCGKISKTLDIDEKTAAHVREIFNMFAKGTSITEIALTMSQKYSVIPQRVSRNGKTVKQGKYCENKIRKILKNPIYAGFVFRKGNENELFEGKHKGLIDRKIWVAVQEKLNAKTPTHKIFLRDRSPFLLKKRLYCSCGAAMTVGGSGKMRKDGSSYLYYVCSQKNHFRSQCTCKTRISLKVIESVVFSALGHYAMSDVAISDIRRNESEYETGLLEEKRLLSIQKSNCDRELKKAVESFRKIEANDYLKRTLQADLKKLSEEAAKVSARLDEVNGELSLLKGDISLGNIQNKAILSNLDALQKNLTINERKAVLDLCIKKLVLKVKNISGYKRDFLLTILPSDEYQSNFGSNVLEIAFTLDNSKGKGEWIITSPFELKCDDFGKAKICKSKGKIKRHWLHEVLRWKQQYESGSTLDEIAATTSVGKSMICRKLKLLTTLTPETIQHILSLKYEKDTKKLTFRHLDKLGKLEKIQSVR